MGDPRRLRKNYKRPTRPFDKVRMEEELVLLGTYGLSNKKELWKHAQQLRRFRQIARELKTMPEERQQIGYSELIGKLTRLGLVTETATSDDVLSLSQKDLLERRLQTMVYKKGLARSIYQARQLVVHKHISVSGKVISSPSYLVRKTDEETLQYYEHSPLKDHPEKLFGESRKAQDDAGSDQRPKTTRKKRTRKSTKKSSRSR